MSTRVTGTPAPDTRRVLRPSGRPDGSPEGSSGGSPDGGPGGVAAAYARCSEITRSEARNFFYGIRLLPAEKRRAMTAVYAMARRIDDIGDGDLTPVEKVKQLEATRKQLHTLTGAGSVATGTGPAEPGDPVLTALADAARRMPIPLGAFDELIDGCTADVEGRTYQSFEELHGYCRCVAGSVGRLSVGIYQPRDPGDLARAMTLADRLGVALQLTNILRDLREDRLTGRIYLPAEDLQRFGCTLSIGPDGTLDDDPEAFAALVRFEADRARSWYAEGLALLPLLDRRSAACTAAMAGIYRRLLERISADPDCVRDRRQSLSGPAKLRVAGRALLWAKA